MSTLKCGGRHTANRCPARNSFLFLSSPHSPVPAAHPALCLEPGDSEDKASRCRSPSLSSTGRAAATEYPPPTPRHYSLLPGACWKMGLHHSVNVGTSPSISKSRAHQGFLSFSLWELVFVRDWILSWSKGRWVGAWLPPAVPQEPHTERAVSVCVAVVTASSET